uniref:AT-hook motif nuclear-localized protein n=1 Tax=Solanum lycopersicum TaxID=4081 RepID=A0A3Q7G5B4_SOLLC|nr:AT-hook motif nuclear-localized protein 17 [Solanum lycopersicum]
MKREYVLEEKNKNKDSNTNTMFGKIHHHHQNQSPQSFQHHHHLHQQQQQQHHHNFQHPPFQLTRECQTSEEADSTANRNDTLNPQPVNAVAPPSQQQQPAGNDGATIEVVRRPRGRPPGSKNKPKPPVIITRDAEPSMSPYILEIPTGVDIINSVTKFCRKRNMGLCVLNGSGTVTNVTLRQPSTTPVSTVTFHGRFDILSISATVVQPNANIPSNNGIANGFTISLAGPQGQVVGGGVVGPLVTAGTVYLIAATFNGPSFHRLPAEEELARNNSGGGNEDGSSPQQHAEVSGGGDGGHPPSTTAPESCGMSMYSCHLPSDVIWAPTARQPQPPPY